MFKLNFGNRYVEYIKTEKTCTVCEMVCLPAHSRFDIRTVFFLGVPRLVGLTWES